MNYTSEDLKRIRIQLNLNQEEMGDRLELSREMVVKMEGGTKGISKFTQKKLAEIESELKSQKGDSITKTEDASAGYGKKLKPFQLESYKGIVSAERLEELKAKIANGNINDLLLELFLEVDKMKKGSK